MPDAGERYSPKIKAEIDRLVAAAPEPQRERRLAFFEGFVLGYYSGRLHETPADRDHEVLSPELARKCEAEIIAELSLMSGVQTGKARA